MPSTPINALPSPDDDSPNDPPIHFDALNAHLDSRLVPRFTTTTARDNAITAPVNGMVCWCDSPGSFYERVGGVWMPRAKTEYGTVALDNTTVPATARLVRVRQSKVTNVSNTSGGFSVPYGFSFTKLMAVKLTAGDTAGNLGFVVPIPANHTLTTGNGQAFQPGGTVVPNGTQIRIEVDAVGYIV